MSANFSSAPACKPIIPIYPVRYGYINIFDDLVPADNPPELSVMMNNRDVKQTKGYAIRLLREGWIYIREEDSNELLHIFKYTQKQNGDAVTECFEKYLYKNKKNAQGGLVLDTSVRKDLPFAFVSADTSQISIVYTEHELSPNLIDRMHQKKDVREQSMQLIDLSAEQTSHSVKATEENLKGLVEDYRDFKERMLTKTSTDGEQVEEFSVDLLTTIPTYEQASDLLAEQLKEEYCNRERARIVTLFDPIGRQMELSQVHAKLVLWENEYLGENIYPYTIGQIVNSFLNSNDQEIKEMAEENVDTSSHKKYWEPMQNNIESFKARKQAILDIFEYFSASGQNQMLAGSSAAYINNFIDLEPSTDDQIQAEVVKVTDLGEMCFAGIATSTEGHELIAKLSEELTSDDIHDETKGLGYRFEKTLLQLVVTPQDGFNWNDVAKKAIDNSLFWMANFLAEMYAGYRYGIPSVYSNEKYKLMKYVAEFYLPNMLAPLGIVIDDKTAKFTSEELGKILSDILNKNKPGNSGNNHARGNSILDLAEMKLSTAQSLFDWANNTAEDVSDKINPNYEQWELARVDFKDSARETATPFVEDIDSTEYSLTGKLGILVDGGFSGVSAWLNLQNINAILIQTEYQSSDPLAFTGRIYSGTKLVSSLTALTVDTLAMARTGLLASQVVVSSKLFAKITSPALASRLLPGLQANTTLISKILVGRLASVAISIANVGSAILSFIDAGYSYRNGQTGLALSYVATGVGSLAIFVGGLAMTAGSTVVGLPAAAVLSVGFVLLIVGSGFLIFFNKNILENLLYNCFWGKNERYPFWLYTDGDKINLSQRVEKAILIETDEEMKEYYQVEMQEFMNIMMMPKLHLKVHRHGTLYNNASMMPEARTYEYEFTLPGFKFGVSELHGGVYTEKENPASNHYMRSMSGGFLKERNEELTNKLKLIVQEKINELTKEYLSNLESGVGEETHLKLKIAIEVNENIELRWHYKPSPDVLVPMRWLSSNGELNQPLIGMVDDRL